MKLTNIIDIIYPLGPFLRSVARQEKSATAGWLALRVVPITFFMHWVFTQIAFGGLFYVIAFTLASAKIHIDEFNIDKRNEKASTYLWYFVATMGFTNLRNFIGHFFMSDFVATNIGWATGSPFQLELAFFQLGISLAALFAIWHRKNLVEGIAIILSVFLLGAAFVHIREITVNANYSAYNTGAILVGDVVQPAILLGLLYASKKRESSNNVDGKLVKD